MSVAGEPDEPAAGAPRRLVPHATAGNLSWSRQYAYDDSGNIINIGSQQFVYDTLGRLKEMATDGSTTESYEYDRYGNQTKRTTTAGVQPMDTEPTTNRLSSGYGYDRAGNVTSGDSYVLAYDPLGQTATKTYTGTTTFNETYIYTANDERIGVQTSNSSETSSWWYWSVRDEGGKVLRQFRSSANDATQAALWIEDYVYRDGQLVGAERPPTLGGRRHFHLDHLGSPRLITSDTGLIVSTHDYLPFGGESSSPFQETGAGFDREDPMKFTGHERDYAGSFGREDAHAIDYMHARYYSATVGRFLSVDPLLGNSQDPQSWNRYSYVRNDPMRNTDPTGEANDGGQKWDVSACIKDGYELVEGAANGWTSSLLYNLNHVEPRSQAYATGQAAGSFAAIPTAFVEGTTGTSLAVTGGTLTVFSNGITGPISVPAAAVGTIMVAHAATSLPVAINNTASAMSRVNKGVQAGKDRPAPGQQYHSRPGRQARPASPNDPKQPKLPELVRVPKNEHWLDKLANLLDAFLGGKGGL